MPANTVNVPEGCVLVGLFVPKNEVKLSQDKKFYNFEVNGGECFLQWDKVVKTGAFVRQFLAPLSNGRLIITDKGKPMRYPAFTLTIGKDPYTPEAAATVGIDPEVAASFK